MEGLEVFLNWDYVVDEYVEYMNLGIIKGSKRDLELGEMLFWDKLIEVKEIICSEYASFAEKFYLNSLSFFHFFYYPIL